MGCISSKVVSRSMSFREELNQRLQRTVKGIIHSDSAADALVRNQTRDSLELIACLEQEYEKQMLPAFPMHTKATESTDADLANGSKSCRWFQEHSMFSLASERSDEINEERSQWSKIGKIHAWSFHAVEEYDSLLERICLSREEQTEHVEHVIKQSPLRDESQVDEHIVAEDKVSNVVKDATPNFEKGFKRKAMANDLQSLRVPTAFEFQADVSLKELLVVGEQVDSPGNYVTPKFGSYTLPSSESVNNCSESVIFDPELVAALEKCLEKLEVDEDNILKQIEDDLQREITKEKQDQEEIPFHTKEQL